MRVRVSLTLLFVAALQAACGGGSTTPPVKGDGPPLDGSVVYADAGCAACHGGEGEGGFGPDITCYPVDGLDAYLRTAATPHVGGAATTLADEDLLALTTFLDQEACTGRVPGSHTDPRNGVAHRPGDAASCAPCHGDDGEGFGRTPACAICHGPEGSLTCAGCHAVSSSGHHGLSDGTDADCRVCHDMSDHRAGTVRLWSDDAVIVLEGDPLTSATEAAKLEAFCLACHDVQEDGSPVHGHGVACAHCHDPHLSTPDAPLRNPDDGEVWTGTMQAFCLTCHDGDEPAGVSFPASTTGSGYDKSAFVGTTHAMELGDDSCIECHKVHGSAVHDLLFDEYVMGRTNARTVGDYAACWDCHSASTILTKDDAFDEYHKKHVIDEDTPCAACHDVHGGTDSAEPGLISFELAIDQSWGLSLPGSTTLSSAFLVDALLGRGSCTLTCHGEAHRPESYER